MKSLFCKLTLLFLILTMLFALPMSVSAESPSDFYDFPDDSHWSTEALRTALANDILRGKGNGRIDAEANLTRAEMAAIITRAFGATTTSDVSMFNDLSADEWYYPYFEKAVKMEVFVGDEKGNMNPNDPITREEAFTVFARAMVLSDTDTSSLSKFGDEADISDWAREYLSPLVRRGYVNGDHNVNVTPKNNITREEFAQFMHNMFKLYYSSAGSYTFAGADSTMIRTEYVNLSDVVIEDDLVIGDGANKSNINLTNVTIKGRLLVRGAGIVKLTNVTTMEGVVVKNVNGTVHFDNFRSESVFDTIKIITPATFKELGGFGGGGGGSGGSGGGGGGVTYYTYHYVEDLLGTEVVSGVNYSQSSVDTFTPLTTSAAPVSKTISGYTLDLAKGDAGLIGSPVTITNGHIFKLYYNKTTYSVSITMPDGTVHNLTYKHGEEIDDRFNIALHPTIKFYYVDAGGVEREVTASTIVTSHMNISTKEPFTVSFNHNNASGTVQNITVYDGDAIGTQMPSTPTYEGYTFAGWNTAIDGSGTSYTSSSLIDGNKTLYAQWTANTYKVWFNANGGDGTMSAQDFTYDVSQSLTANTFTKPGYTFNGWNTESNGTGTHYNNEQNVSNLTSAPNGEVTFYAQWILAGSTTKNVTFDPNYIGAVTTTIPVVLNNPVTQPAPPTRDGYTFAGWFTDAGCTLGNEYNFSTPVTSDITLYAKWEINKYTVSFDSNGGSAVAPQTDVAHGSTIGAPTPAPTKTGCTFEGWYKDSGLTDDFDFGVDTITSNTTLYAKWSDNIYTITIKTPGESDRVVNVVHGQTVSQALGTDPTREGYTFTGYNTALDGTGTSYTSTTQFTESVTLHTQWQIKKYTVSFNSNGGSAVAPQTDVAHGSKIDAPTPAPEKTGYTLDGWYKDALFADDFDFSVDTITGTTTLYAKWTANTYTVKFDANTGTGTMADQPFTYDVAQDLTANAFTKTGYTFAGWNTAADGSGTTYTDNQNVSNLTAEDGVIITLYAQWTPNTYTVKFDANTGTGTMADQSFTYDVAQDLTANAFTKTGYTFAGWNTAADGSGTSYTDNQNVINLTAENGGIITLYAQWIPNTYTVKYDANTGTGTMADQPFTYDTAQNLTANTFTRTGYTFAGWNSSSDGTGLFTFTNGQNVNNLTAIPNDEITLYAQWTPNTYTVKYDANTGTGTMADQLFTYDVAQDLTANAFTKTGYTFAGWNTAANGSGTPYTNSQNVSNLTSTNGATITLYAQWTPNTYTVKFNSNDGTDTIVNQLFTYDVAQNLTINTFTREGYIFKGWNTESNGSGTSYSDGENVINLTSAPSGEFTLYAKWEIKTYTVTFNSNGGSAVGTQTINHGSKATLPTPAPTRDGHTFKGWKLSGADYDFNTPVTSNIELVAEWEINKYTVTFDSDGGSAVAPITNVIHGSVVSAPTAPTKDGYIFKGWTLDSTDYDFLTPVTANITLKATWEIKTYAVTFETYGGSAVTIPNVAHGSKIPTQSAPTKADATFAGWYLDETFGTEYDFNTPVTGPVTLYAKWLYTVTFDTDGGSAVAPQTNIVHGTKATKPSDPTKSGKIFGGWFTDVLCTVSYSFDSAVTNSITLYAKWTDAPVIYRTVTFNTNGGSVVAPYTDVVDGTKITAPTAPTKTGYTFAGWYKDTLFADDFDFANDTVTSDITLYAKWDINEYTVTFDSDGGSAVAPQTIKYNEKATPPTPNPTMTGYTFKGWTLGGTAYDFNTPVTDDITLKATWEINKYTVTFDSDGGSAVAPITDVTHGSKVSAPSTPTMTGYTFKGWTLGGTAYDFNTPVTDDITLKATWEINEYTVTFNSDGGSAVESQTIKYNNKATKPVNPTKTGYTFDHWYVDESHSRVFNFETEVITENTTLYAGWIINTYTVTFDSDGGSTVAPQYVNYRKTATLPMPNPTKTGYTFICWTLNGTAYDFATPVTDDIELVAEWEINEYVVSFITFSESVVPQQIIEYNQKATKPNDPTKAGHTFKGWYADDTYLVEFNFETTLITDHTEIYAKWEINTYTVSFNSNGGSAVSSQTVDYNDTAYSPAPYPTKPGYIFKSWNLNGAPYDFGTPVTSNIELVADWELEEYTVTFNTNGGVWNTSAPNIKYTIETLTFNLPTDISKEGYIFSGWFEDSMSATPVDKIEIGSTGNKSYIANWMPITYTVEYNGNGGTGITSFSNHTYDVLKNLTQNGFSKSGYTFNGWNTEANGSGTSYYDREEVKNLTNVNGANVTLYAQWKENSYTVEFYANNGTDLTKSQEFKYVEEKALTENTFAKTGYTFNGWNTDANGNGTAYADKTIVSKLTDIPNGTFKLYAQWTPVTYTVVFNGNGDTSGAMTNQSFVYDAPQTLNANNFVKIGYTFNGWNTRVNGNGTPYANNASVLNLANAEGASVTLYAQWEPITYYVHYDANTGNGTMSDSSHKYDIAKALSANTFTKTGYTFNGWNTEANGSGTSYGNGASVLNLASTEGASVTLYAQWKPNTYYVVYNGNGHTSGSTAQSVHTYNTSKNLTLNAYGKTGYTFLGWALSATGDVEYTDEQSVLNLTTIPNGTVQLYAKWQPITYTVIFNGNGNTSGTMENQSFVYDIEQNLTPVGFTKDGYTFMGWGLTSDATNVAHIDNKLVKNLTSVPDGEVTLYALWEANNYKVVYVGYQATNTEDAGVGETYESTHKYDETKPLTENKFERTGYTFKGWTTTPPVGMYSLRRTLLRNATVVSTVDFADSEEVVNLTAVPNGVVTLYPVWEANTYTVKYDKNSPDATGTVGDSTYIYDQFYNLNSNGYRLTGYKFIGWSEDENATTPEYLDGEQVSNLTATPNGTVTLYAVWEENSYTVKFEANGGSGSMADLTVKYTESKQLTLNAFQKEGYDFIGWSTNPNATTTEFADGQTVLKLKEEGTVTLYAIWKAKTFTITFNVNGGNALDISDMPSGYYVTSDGKIAVDVTYDSQYPTLPNATTSDVSKYFAGWFIEDTENQIVAGNTVKILANTEVKAKWSDKLVHNVVFNDYNENGTPYNSTVIDGEKVAKPSDPTRTGYTFKGWYADSTLQTEYNFNNVFIASSVSTINIYPKWEINKYTVTFDSDGGSAVGSQIVNYNSKATVPTKPTLTGYNFVYWMLNGEEYDFDTPVTDDITLTAKWEIKTFTVAFNTNGGSSVTSQSVKYNEKANEPITKPTKTGYKFESWQYEDVDYDFNTPVTDDITLAAKWSAVSYNITYNTDDGVWNSTYVVPDKYDIETTVTLPVDGNITKDGYTLSGWVLDTNPNDIITEIQLGNTGHKTLIAKWTANSYTVTFNANGGVGADKTQSFTYGVPQNLTKNTFTRVGYKFNGWNTDANGNGTSYADEAQVSNLTKVKDGTVTLYAQWTPITYKFRFNANGGTGEMDDQTFTFDAPMQSLTKNTFTRTGYTFKQWSLNADGSGEVFADEASLRNYTAQDGKIITLYAQWSINEYTVIFNSNGGLGTMANQSFEYDEEKELAENTYTKEGYTFKGWTKDINGTGTLYTDKQKVKKLTDESTITLYAQWEINKYTVKFNSNGGNAVSDYTDVEHGSKIDTPVNVMTKNGYEFDGWYKEAELLNAFDFANDTITENTTLYAKWNVVTYTIEFNLNNGDWNAAYTAPDSYNIESDDITLPTEDNVSKEGYTFLGWFESQSSNTPVLSILTGSTGNKEYIAKWEANKYTVKFHTNEGTGTMADQTFTYDVVQNLTKNTFTRTGYTFKGWNTDANGNGTSYNDETQIYNLTSEKNGEVTLYAQWEINKYTVTFNSDGGSNVAPQTIDYNSKATVPNEPTKTGYTFKGWMLNGTAYDFDTPVTDDIELTAKWEINKYSIFFVTNGGSILMPQMVEHGSLLTKPNDPTKEGYKLEGWYTDRELTQKYDFSNPVTKAFSLYAKWEDKTYTVTFDSNGGTLVAPQIVKHGEYAQMPENPTKDGHIFKKWTYEGWPYDFDTPVTSDITLVANWTTITGGGEGEKVDVFFVVDGMHDGANIYDKNDPLSKLMPADPTKTGYTFTEWNTKSDGTGTTYTATSIVTGEISPLMLYAQFKANTYTVKYYGSGATSGSMEDDIFTYDEEKALSLNTYEREGYVFEGWGTLESMGSVVYRDGDVVKNLASEDGAVVSLIASWSVDIDVPGVGGTDYNVTFIVDGTSTSKAVNSNKSFSEYIDTPTKTGYTFASWNTSLDGTGDSYTQESKPSSNLTLYAQWNANTYTIKYDGSGATSGSMEDDIFTYDEEKALALNTYEREGFVFSGWTAVIGSELKNFEDGETVKNLTAENGAIITLTAVWLKDVSGGNYNVTYVVDGIINFVQNVSSEKPLSDYIDTPTKDGYTFDGWNTANDGTGDSYTQDSKVSSNLTLYAQWKADEYTITYDLGIGEMLNEVAFVNKYTVEDNVILPVASDFKERTDGYEFAGWYTDALFESSVVTEIEEGTKGNLTFYAKWEQKFVVTFYDGPIVDSEWEITDKKVGANTNIAQADIDAVLDELDYKRTLKGYKDGSYTHILEPEFWYITDSGKWEIFDETVTVKSDMDVFYTFKMIQLYFDISVGEFELPIPVTFSVPYESDTRVMDSLKDAMTIARREIVTALNIDDIYMQAIEKAAEKSKGIIDAEGNIKFIEADIPISKIIKTSEIGGEIREYFKRIITSNTDDAKIESLIYQVKDTNLIANTVLGGASYNYDAVKAYITSLDETSRASFASNVFSEYSKKQSYKDFIKAFDTDSADEVAITSENVNLIMGVADAVNEYQYEELKDRIYNSFGAVVDILGDEAVEDFMRDAQDRYYIGANDVWNEVESNGLDATYPTFLTFKLNAIEHVLKPVYKTYHAKAVERMETDNLYHYNENPYLKELVDVDIDTYISDLLYEVPVTDENIGYALWPSTSSESGFMHYYDYAYEKLLLIDKALLWYGDELTDAQIEALKDSVFGNAAKAINKFNEMLDAYEKDGSLPIGGKKISDLMEFEAFAKIFGNFEGTINKVIDKYKSTIVYGKTWTGDGIRNDYEFVEKASNIALGLDDPTYNIDSLMEESVVVRALNKLGFKDFAYPGDDAEGAVTVDAIERILNDNRVFARRYYQ